MLMQLLGVLKIVRLSLPSLQFSLLYFGLFPPFFTSLFNSQKGLFNLQVKVLFVIQDIAFRQLDLHEYLLQIFIVN